MTRRRAFMRRVISVAAAVLLVGSFHALADEPEAGKQVAQTFRSAKSKATLDYLLYLPQDFKAAGHHPVLLFLHGSGERGNDVTRVLKHGPPRLIAAGQHLPMIVVSPQCPAETRWDAAQLLELLDHVQAHYSGDPQRVYVTGLSMGGSGTWSLLTAAPQRFAAAMPICGRGNAEAVAPASQVPVWIVVGDRDAEMLVANCRDMARQIEERGGDVKLTIQHGVGHDSWTLTYSTPETYDWLLRHRRTESPRATTTP